MAAIVWNAGEEVFLNVVLNATTSGFTTNSAAIPGSGANWGVGLGSCTPLGTATNPSNKSFNNGSNQTNTLAEIAQTNFAGCNYARQALARNTSGWPLSTVQSGSHQTSAPQVTFGQFSATPNLNGATLWFVAKSTTVGTVDCLFGADLATTRSFASGDTEKLTITFRSSS